MFDSYTAEMVDRAADRRGYGRTGRLPCGSLRLHEAHEWTGQTTGLAFTCSGQPPTFPERCRLADRRLHEESNGVTDDWREDA